MVGEVILGTVEYEADRLVNEFKQFRKEKSNNTYKDELRRKESE